MLEYLLPAAGAVVSGLFGMQGARDSREYMEKQADINYARSKEFAQNRLQWAAEDAVKAGFSRQVAAGAPASSPALAMFNDPVGAAMGSMGQDLSRAAFAGATAMQRDGAMGTAQKTLMALGVERAGLQNELLKSQIARLRSAQAAPAVPEMVPLPRPRGEDPYEVPERSAVPFVVGEQAKREERPQLMYGGSRWVTNPNTSPMKAWEDQYGDEGPVSWLMPIMILYQDMKANFGEPSRWPLNAAEYFADRVEDLMPARSSGRHARPSMPLGRR